MIICLFFLDVHSVWGKSFELWVCFFFPTSSTQVRQSEDVTTLNCCYQCAKYIFITIKKSFNRFPRLLLSFVHLTQLQSSSGWLLWERRNFPFSDFSTPIITYFPNEIALWFSSSFLALPHHLVLLVFKWGFSHSCATFIRDFFYCHEKLRQFFKTSDIFHSVGCWR